MEKFLEEKKISLTVENYFPDFKENKSLIIAFFVVDKINIIFS